MSFLASLQSLFARLVERAREWNQRAVQASSDRKDDDDDFSDFFLFGPHG
jgi:hypothetical protein